MKPTSLLWLAFQPNAISDVANEDSYFEGAFKEMKIELQNFDFHFPNLRVNMRNSGPISKIEVNHTNNYYNTSNVVNHLASTVTGKIPTVGPEPELWAVLGRLWVLFP